MEKTLLGIDKIIWHNDPYKQRHENSGQKDFQNSHRAPEGKAHFGLCCASGPLYTISTSITWYEATNLLSNALPQ
jgi:hypothetical protein